MDIATTAADIEVRRWLTGPVQRQLDGQRPRYRVTTEDLYRLDSRPPDVVRRDGLLPRREAMEQRPVRLDIRDHVGGGWENSFVSLTRDAAFPDRHASWVDRYRYLYRIDGTRALGGIDVNAMGAVPTGGPDQQEVLFVGGVAADLIVEAWELTREADGSVTRQPSSLVSDPPPPRSWRAQIDALTEQSISQTGAVLWLELNSLTRQQVANERAAVGAMSRLPNTITIVGHVNAAGRLRIGGTALEAAELAQLVRELPGYRADQTVILLACDTATARPPSEVSFAAGLHTALDGNPVIGSRADVWHDRNGRQRSGWFTVDFARTLRPRPVDQTRPTGFVYLPSPHADDRTRIELGEDLYTGMVRHHLLGSEPPAAATVRVPIAWADDLPAAPPVLGEAGRPAADGRSAVPSPQPSIQDILTPDGPAVTRSAEPAVVGVMPASMDDVLNPRPHALLEFLERVYGDTAQVRAFAADAAIRFAEAMEEGPRHPHIVPPPDDPERPTMLYHGWMYAADAVPVEAAERLQSGQALTMPGFVRASASEASIPAGAAVVLAIYGTALDLSVLRGQPPGTDLLIMPGTSYTVTAVAAHTDTTPTRLTLTE